MDIINIFFCLIRFLLHPKNQVSFSVYKFIESSNKKHFYSFLFSQ